MKIRRLDILGIGETHLRGETTCKDLGDGFTLISSSVKEGRSHAGVAINVGPRLKDYIQNITIINKRIVSVQIRVKNSTYSITQIYAPQQG